MGSTSLRLRAQYVSVFLPPRRDLARKKEYRIVLYPSHFHTSAEPIEFSCSSEEERWYYAGDIVVRCGKVSSPQFFMKGKEFVHPASFMTIYSWRPIIEYILTGTETNVGSGDVPEDALKLVFCSDDDGVAFEYSRTSWYHMKGDHRHQIPGEWHTSDRDLTFLLHERRDAAPKVCFD